MQSPVDSSYLADSVVLLRYFDGRVVPSLCRSGTYLPYVATTLNNLGVLDHTQNRLEEARKALDES